MIRPYYVDILTPAERQEALETGIKLACMRNGIKLGDGAADWFSKIPEAIGKTMLTVSVMTGVPLGIASHLVSRAMKSDEIAQREQRAKIKYYRDVTNELSQGLTDTNGPKPVAL